MVPHQPWRRPLLYAFTVVVGVGGIIVGYALGQNSLLSSKISQTNIEAALDDAQTQLVKLEAELIDARLNASVQREASNALREDLTAEHRKSARLAEELAFYKGLMAPSSLPNGLQIAELEVAQTDQANTYSYQLLLTQVAMRRSYIAGEVRLDVIGKHSPATADPAQKGGEAVLSLTELDEAKKYPLKFRFRYFQDLTGRITLPEGFEPDRVLVTANQNGKEPLQVTFPWPVT